MVKEDIIIRIKKLLALSKSKNQNESQLCMVKAMELIAKHKLSMAEVENYNSEKLNITSNITKQSFNKKNNWKSYLSGIIADKFGCIVYHNTYYRSNIVFYGKEEDTKICEIMLEYAIKEILKYGRKLEKEIRNRQGYANRVIYNYAIGFTDGLNEKFSNEIEEYKDEWGLILKRDIRVDNAYKEFSKDFVKKSTVISINNDSGVYKDGYKKGKTFDIRSRIEEEENQENILIE